MVKRQHPLNSNLENVTASNSKKGMRQAPRILSASLGRKSIGSKTLSSRKQNMRHRRYAYQYFIPLRKCFVPQVIQSRKLYMKK